MKRFITLLLIFQAFTAQLIAQCSICTKTASQMGEEAGKGFNAGVLYLAAMPFAIIVFIAYRYRKNEKA
ncbi:MAG: hypothetical protein RLZ56_510 [Bacteroidota bacterium]|jgi:hypothetical protein